MLSAKVNKHERRILKWRMHFKKKRFFLLDRNWIKGGKTPLETKDWQVINCSVVPRASNITAPPRAPECWQWQRWTEWCEQNLGNQRVNLLLNHNGSSGGALLGALGTLGGLGGGSVYCIGVRFFSPSLAVSTQRRRGGRLRASYAHKRARP